MADSVKKAVPPKAPRPVMGGASAAARAPDPDSAPPPASAVAASAPEPVESATAATDILNGGAPQAELEPDARASSLSAIHAVPTVGDRIGKYVVDRLIGSGGMGLVLAARDPETGQLVAIKLLRPKAAGDKIHAERFAREARAITKIKSPHVVRVLDASTLESGAPYIVMEHLVGRDLAQILREEGAMRTAKAADIMLQICEAVASAHAVGVIHRDLKPSNFFVTERPDGTPLVKVLDFGIAKAIGTDGVVDPNLTETQAVFGSPTYMSPEQIRSAKHVDHRSDIWSLGVALYELLTGRLPFAADNVAGLLASVVADPPYFPRGFVPDLPQPLEDLLLSALIKDPRHRIQSVSDLAYGIAPFATPSAETQALLESTGRLSARSPPIAPGSMAPGSNGPGSNGPGSIGPGPRQPSPSMGPYEPSGMTPPFGHAFPPGGQRDPRHSGVAFGSTGIELGAEPGHGRGRNVVTAIAIAIGVMALCVGGLGAYHFGTLRPAPAAARSATTIPPSASSGVAAGSGPSSSAGPAGPGAATSASASAPDPSAKAIGTSTPASGTASGVTPAAGVTGKKVVPKHGGAKSSGAAPAATPKPVDPTNDRF